MWVAFEGHDGSGKTSTAEAVAMELSKQGKDVLFIRTPGTTSFGKYIRANWHKNETVRMLQFIANHVEVIEEVVKPQLSKGGWVVQDRLYLSSLVYSGWAGKLSLEGIATTAKLWIDKMPDLLFVLQCSTEVALARLSALDKDLIDPDGTELDKIRWGYAIEAKVHKADVVDTTEQPQEDVIKYCLQRIAQL